MVTAAPGYKVDPNNPNGVVPINTPAPVAQPNYIGTGAQTTPVNTNGNNGTPLPNNAAPATYVDTTGKTQQNLPVIGAPTNTATSSSTNGVTPAVQPQSEDEIYAGYVTQGQSVLDAINASTQAQIQQANLQIDQNASKAQQDQNGVAAITGGFGSGSAAGSNQIAQDAGTKKTTADAGINAASQQQVATYLSNLQSAAQSQANYEQTTAFSQGQTYDQYLKTTATNTLQGLAKSGVTLAQLQSQAQSGNSVAQQTMQTLLQAYNNDPNALNAAAALATPVASVVQSFTNGSTYNQIVRDPNTNAISVQSFDLGITPPTGWTSNKVSTNTLLLQDPNNPANTIVYTTNPLTGDVQVTGTGTGQSLASQYQGNQSSGGSSNSSTTPPTGAGTASTTVSSILGVDPTTSFDDVVSGSGLGTLTAAMIQNEGGSPSGVVNNPGNVKFVGAPGQTDSGVKATDGGTFASYSTPAAGQQAIASTLNSIASKQQNPTLQSVVDAYTNTGSTQAPGTGTNGLPTAEYGLLANVQGFDPTGKNSSAPAGVDTAAMNYLNEYLTQGKTPTAASVGISTRAGSGALFNTISQRADDVYFKATGQHLPDQNILSANKTLLTGNNTLLNSLAVQEKTIAANSDLLQNKINAQNINQNAPIINNVIDGIKNALGDPNVASYLAQNSTLSNELGSLLALKNASGTTVHDKLISADLISPSASAAQEAEVVNTLMQEAGNARSAIGQANANLYQQIDPLGLQPGNPINQPGYQELNGAGFTNNYDGTWAAPDGTVYKVDAQGNVTQQ